MCALFLGEYCWCVVLVSCWSFLEVLGDCCGVRGAMSEACAGTRSFVGRGLELLAMCVLRVWVLWRYATFRRCSEKLECGIVSCVVYPVSGGECCGRMWYELVAGRFLGCQVIVVECRRSYERGLYRVRRDMVFCRRGLELPAMCVLRVWVLWRYATFRRCSEKLECGIVSCVVYPVSGGECCGRMWYELVAGRFLGCQVIVVECRRSYERGLYRVRRDMVFCRRGLELPAMCVLRVWVLWRYATFRRCSEKLECGIVSCVVYPVSGGECCGRMWYELVAGRFLGCQVIVVECRRSYERGLYRVRRDMVFCRRGLELPAMCVLRVWVLWRYATFRRCSEKLECGIVSCVVYPVSGGECCGRMWYELVAGRFLGCQVIVVECRRSYERGLYRVRRDMVFCRCGLELPAMCVLRVWVLWRYATFRRCSEKLECGIVSCVVYPVSGGECCGRMWYELVAGRFLGCQVIVVECRRSYERGLYRVRRDMVFCRCGLELPAMCVLRVWVLWRYATFRRCREKLECGVVSCVVYPVSGERVLRAYVAQKVVWAHCSGHT